MERIGIYLRISDDADGTSTATDRQRQDCRRYAEQRGWTVADTFEDRDLSAYKPNVRRPEFERMLTAVRDHEITGVLAWKIDRISRRLRDFVRLDEQCEQAGAFISTVEGNVNTREASGRFLAELLTAQARMESANTSARILRKQQELREQGKPSIGGYRLFGYSHDRLTVIPEEAVVAREARDRVLAGESLRAVAKDFGRRGIVGTSGKGWQPWVLKRYLWSAALSGQREHGGLFTPGSWPAIFTPQDTLRLRAVLERNGHTRAARTNLLGGFLRCGREGCGAAMQPSGGKVRRYVCRARPGRPNCGRTGRRVGPIEAMVTAEVCKALDGVALREYLGEPSDRTVELLDAVRADEAALAELADDFYAKRLISRPEFFATRATIDQRLEHN